MSAMVTDPVSADAQLEVVQQVAVSLLTDGMVVRLSGPLGADQLPVLRDVLLTALPAGCRDVVVDAGEVTSIAVEALAVLFAAWAWTEEHDGRFLLSRSSVALDDALVQYGVADELPRLAGLPRASRTAGLPRQRSTRD